MYTVVSIVPFNIVENKPGLFPGQFIIPAAQGEDFNILHVGPSKYYVYLDSERGYFEAQSTEKEVAESIVMDYSVAQVGYGDGSQPGLFIIPEKLTKEEIRKKYSGKLSEIRAVQNNWFRRLVTLADDDWARYHQHKMISDLQRFAAQYLGMDREWLIQATDEVKRCPGCRTVVDPLAIICSNCRTVLNKAEYDKLIFAKV
jgi:hypothetical protein